MTVGTVPAGFRAVVARLRRAHPVPLVVSDTFVYFPAFYVAGLLRNELSPISSVSYGWSTVIQVALIGVVAFLAVGWIMHLYRSRYRVSTFEEVFVLGCAWAVSTVAAVAANFILFSPRVPNSIVTMGMMQVGAWMAATRVLIRLVRRAENRPDDAGRSSVLVFGAGDGGSSVIKSMLSDSRSRYVPVGLIDDDPRKRNRVIEGVRVLGTSDDISRLSPRADMLLIAVPSASPSLVARVAATADEAGLDVMILPSTTELFGMLATIDKARPLGIADLLGRDEVEIDDQSVANYLFREVVLVTGAGGSIGSEICRQILRYEPARLVMLDRDETALQGLQLSVSGHGLLEDDNLVLADIRDRDRMFEVFEKHLPTIVFHAAALKHLPLLELHPREGFLTNVLGTKNLLDAAKAGGVRQFVNVSTDKAANPTSVLGTTKRLAEALTVHTGLGGSGQYISVRFGNVIGSRGSVLPAFEAQIAAGGPVTVTHPDVTRFFMSIPEASRLVLQAGAIGKTGETLVLDMGEPMKVADLAKNLIRHHKSDAKIVYTGLRPNEKLHEVLGHDGEVMGSGPHPRIWHTVAVVGTESLDDLSKLEEAPPDRLAQELLKLTYVQDVSTATRDSDVPGTSSRPET